MGCARPLAAVLVALACVAAPASAHAALDFRDCRGVGCARLSVPLDRTGATEGRISLYVERRSATRRPRRGVTLLLAGGPGQPATRAYAGAGPRESYREFRALTPRNDIVAFDPRGTGRSGLLRCPRLERANLVDAGAAAGECARRLGPRRAFYRTLDTVADIEALRRELGVARLTLIGVSYGTLVAQLYAASYPDRVERVLLDSVLDVSGWDPLYRDIFGAVPRVLGAICRSGCRRFTADPAADLGRLVQRIAARGPLRGRVTQPDGRRRPSTLSREELFFTLVSGDLDDVSRSAFPGAVISALRGDPAPLLRLKRRALASEGSGGPRDFSTALYAATSCEEIPFPWARFAPFAGRLEAARAAADALPPAGWFPFDAATAARNDFIMLCRRWPEASPAPLGAPPGPLPNVPVLMLVGENDLRTPLEGATAAAADWPSAQVLVSPNTGHSALSADLSGCASRATLRFFRSGHAPRACRRGRPAFPVTPPLPDSLRVLRPVRGVAGDRGRMLRALELTLYDVAEEFVAALFTGALSGRGAGLRGGTWRLGLTGQGLLRLRRLELVPGVRVSGTISAFGSRGQRGRVRVSGPAGPGGRLTVRGRRVTGRLGGRRVRGRILAGVELGAAHAGTSERPSLEALLRAGRELAERRP